MWLYMGPNPKADYSLRYDKHGIAREINNLSPLLTAPEYSIDEVDEDLRGKFPIMREAVRISRNRKYDMDMFTGCGLYIIVYHDCMEFLGLTELMRLFSQAHMTWITTHKFGKLVELTAVYLIN